MTNYSFLTVTKGDEFTNFSMDEIAYYKILDRCNISMRNENEMTTFYNVKVILKNGNEHLWYFNTLEEAKNSIKIIGDIRC